MTYFSEKNVSKKLNKNWCLVAKLHLGGNRGDWFRLHLAELQNYSLLSQESGNVMLKIEFRVSNMEEKCPTTESQPGSSWQMLLHAWAMFTEATDWEDEDWESG